jgi:hypothetical protein
VTKTVKKPTATRRKKSTSRKSKTPRPYRMPKTAAEHGLTCLSSVGTGVCGKAVIWFDYQLGEKEFYKGFVCDAHRVSHRIEKLAQPESAVLSPKPIDMILHCPECDKQHVDAPEPENGWTNPPHKTHLCHGCGTLFRPADVPTNGVATVNAQDQPQAATA